MKLHFEAKLLSKHTQASSPVFSLFCDSCFCSVLCALGFLIEAGRGWWMAEVPAAHTLAHLQYQLKYSGLLHFRAPALPPSLLHLSHQPDPSVDLPLPIYLYLHLSLSHLAPGAPAKSSAEPESSSISPLT